MRRLQDYNLTESQFAQLIGKVRLYQYLPAKEKKLLPEFEFTDTHVNLIARNFYRDENFSYSPAKKNINMWQVFNLFTEANKCSYIDTFLNRSTGATNFTQGICEALEGKEGYGWFVE